MKQIISAAVTPYTADDKVDLESAARLYEFDLRQGIDGFFIFGSMGEWALLTNEEKDLLAECACSVIGDKAKILLGIADTGMPNILRNMERLHHLTHSHWTVILPPELDRTRERSCRVFAQDCRCLPIARCTSITSQCFNGVTVTTEQFRDILSHPKIAGIKEFLR